MNIEAVIGANYGDEGKGMFTDYLCSNRMNPIVVMTNGGSQRGHTVEFIDKKTNKEIRFVFHHFSSGTFSGAITYFPKTFLLNPMQFVKEFYELTDLGYNPVSFHHHDCIIQLPCDIALNWHIEKSRGENKHGSVGCGIWETKYRMYNGDFCTLNEFCSMIYEDQVAYIHQQAKKYRDIRCKEENLKTNADIYDLFMSSGFIDHFISDCVLMNKLCHTENDILKIGKGEDSTLIFENGQGLKLDQFYGSGDEKNTTPSFTGSIGIVKLLNEMSLPKIDNVNLNYISRTYLTKHGAGKFIEENPFDDLKFDDRTNIRNEWQDSLRFATLDNDELLRRCENDKEMFTKFIDYHCKVYNKLVMTHCNEIKPADDMYSRIDYMSSSKYSKDFVVGINK